MSSLFSQLPLPEKRQAIVDDCVKLLDSEVRRKKGIGGLAIKGGYKILKAFKPGAVPDAVNGLFDDFVKALDPLHGQYADAAQGSFGGHMQGRADEVAEALLGVTDRRADGSRHKTLVKGYRKLRPSAKRHVIEAVPGLAVLFDKYYGEKSS